MSTALNMHLRCAGCGINLKKINGRKKKVFNEEEANLFSECFERTISVNDILCQKCRLSTYKKKKSGNDSDLEMHRDLPSSESTSDPTFSVTLKRKETMPEEYIEIPIQRTVSTHKLHLFSCEKSYRSSGRSTHAVVH